MSVLLEYECRVPVGGYDVITIDHQWHDPAKTIEKVRMLHPRSKRTRRFDLFESSSSVFLEFAQTPLTEDRVKDLADRYGPLSDDRGSGGYKYEWGRSIDAWFANIRWMRRTVELWRKSTVTGDFSRIIREIGTHFEIIGAKLTGVPIALLLKKDPLSASPKLCIRPVSFQEALWAQLVLAIDGNVNLRACVQCRRWFTLEAGRGRSDKEYCSNACRMRAYRKRKGTA
jgi:hypothetical protein